MGEWGVYIRSVCIRTTRYFPVGDDGYLPMVWRGNTEGVCIRESTINNNTTLFTSW